MLEIESLRYELVTVSEKVGRHALVAEIAKISVTYLSQIRKGKNVTLDSSQNKKLMSSLINIYSKIGEETIEEITIALK